jgi:hypothetical protein
MKTFFKLILFLLPLLLLNSCQDVVQIKLDQGSKLYVVDAFVNDLRTTQTIRVTTNDSYFSDREAPPVANATVLLKDLTGNAQYAFGYAGDGNYQYTPALIDTIARLNHQYELDVIIDGVTYTSLTVQKRTAVIDSISARYRDGKGGGFGGQRAPYYTCELWAKDKVDNNADYYWIKTYRNDTLFSASNDINVCIDGTGGPVTSAELDSVFFTPPAIFLGSKRYQSGNTCKAEVHSISHDTYFFLIQAQAQISNGGLFATTPENVKSNIVTPKGATTKAIGWFNMASVASKKIVIP